MKSVFLPSSVSPFGFAAWIVRQRFAPINRLACGAAIVALAASIGTPSASAADIRSLEPLPPEIAKASQEPEQAVSTIRIPEGWRLKVWAAEPDVANVVAFDIDNDGGIYVCETFRQNRGVTDNRGHDKQWLMADLKSKTVQDRIDYHKKLLGEAAITYAQHDDRIRYLSDDDGDGRADKSTIVADGFNDLEEGTGAGVLAIGDSVYYTCIPKLWKLVDKDGDRKVDQRVVLSDGYGVRVAFRGHDMHGLIRGYDGRLYFTIGDRGYHIRTPEGDVLADPASGAVFRCELDGSGLEVFARGLRNPQEIDFNDVGDWFTVDNNSDSGDQARIVHLLQDGDTGWRMYYQYLPDRGPFNRERIWEPENKQQPAAIVPPVANFTDGPSGLAYYPGTGFGNRFDDTFLICDFRGGSSNSGIRSFRVEPKGATYELISDDQPIWKCLATDVAFGPDGALYVSDWVDGWDGLGKARIYRIEDPQHVDDAVVQDVKKWLAKDWTAVPAADLVSGLSHRDRRVRLECQWQLAGRGKADELLRVVVDAENDLTARRHAVWGLGQIARTSTNPAEANIESTLVGLINGKHPTLSVAALQIAGELGWKSAASAARGAIAHDDARVRYHAIDASGRLGDHEPFASVVKVLSETKSLDAAMRHAAVMYLSRAVSAAELGALAEHQQDSVRLAAVVALRRQGHAAVAKFLGDANSRVVLEAARAIHDTPIEFAMAALSELTSRPLENRALAERVLNANYRLGTEQAAARVAKFATRSEASETMRIEALQMLGNWAKPNPLDRVLGDYRPVEPRSAEVAAAALMPQIDLLMAAPENVRVEAIDVAAKLGIKKIAPELLRQVGQTTRTADARGKALLGLARLEPSEAVRLADALPEAEVRGPLGAAALQVLANHASSRSIDRFVTATGSSDTKVQQLAWDILAKIDDPKATKAISDAVQQYIEGQLSPRVQLNVIEAANGRVSADIQKRLDEHRQNVAQSDPLGPWLDSLSGGDPDRGSKLFFGKTELSCVRCHKVGRAGGEVGPKLTVVGKERDRRYLLEAICLPDAKIAEGFETTVIIDIDGRVHGGIVKAENDDYVELVLADGSSKRIAQDDIEARRKGKSSMPADLVKQMTARELRDLVAYLAGLKVDPRAAGDVE